MTQIGFIGTGNMAIALIKSLNNYKIISSDTNQEKLGRATEIGIVTTSNNKEVVEKSDIIFLCVKPNNIKEILEEIKNSIQDQIIISIAAGIRIKQIEKVIGDKKIVRVMPNLNCVVKEMAAAFCCNKQITSQDKEKVKKILNFAGLAIEVQEDQMDVVTALSGSGPAFITYILNVISKSAEIQGLSKQVSYQLALQTFLGTAKLLKQTKEDPNNLIKRVASPGGTTIVGLQVLENSEIKSILEKVIEAATKRSKELSKDEMY